MKPVFHIHIPKTGGSWFNSVMIHHLGNLEVSPDGRFVDSSHSVFELTSPLMKLPIWMGASGARKVIIALTGLDDEGATVKNAFARPDTWDIVSIVRNPFDLLVSMWSHDHPVDRERVAHLHPIGVPVGWDCINVTHGIREFDGFVKRITDPQFAWIHKAQQASLFHAIRSHKQRQITTHILRQERLVEGTRALLVERGCEPDESVLGRAASNTSARRPDYRTYYTDDLRERVERTFADDLSLFGYNFDGLVPDAVGDADTGIIRTGAQNTLPAECIDTYTIALV